MWLKHLDILVDPESKAPLDLRDAKLEGSSRVRSGQLVEKQSGRSYPIVDFIPRFVSSENYAKGFGLQWNIHDVTQHDAFSGFPISQERFRNETRWSKDLSGQTVLEVGCGSGRFTTHALETGGRLVSFDFSNAVEANFRLNGDHPSVLMVQADVFHMPFRKGYFDKAFCFGVLQHTPDPHRAFMEIIAHIRPGGKIASDIYIKDFISMVFGTKYKIRPFLRNPDPEKLYQSVKNYIDFMWPLASLIRKIPRFGKSINWMLMIADYSNRLKGADDLTLRQWAYLDTFDMLAPKYDKPQTVNTFRHWHQEAGLVDIDVKRGYNGVEGRGTIRKG